MLVDDPKNKSNEIRKKEDFVFKTLWNVYNNFNESNLSNIYNFNFKNPLKNFEKIKEIIASLFFLTGINPI